MQLACLVDYPISDQRCDQIFFMVVFDLRDLKLNMLNLRSYILMLNLDSGVLLLSMISQKDLTSAKSHLRGQQICKYVSCKLPGIDVSLWYH